ncbi:MAG: hypothetical protein VB031_09030 [Eubacteriaceae bacterium]|nr:hypothetical protein [Eubacteriaceae bacterium]
MPDYASEMLEALYERLDSEEKELKGLPEGSLIKVGKSRGKTKYGSLEYYQKGDGRKQKRTVIDSAEVEKLARKKYLRESVFRVKKNIAFLERIVKEQISVAPSDIVVSLPGVYKTLPGSAFFPKESAAHRWAAEKYVMNPKKPEGRRLVSPAGYKVRSKSELIISQQLFNRNVPHRYEPLMTDLGWDLRYSPDFAVMRPADGKLFIWEHCGLTTDPDYMFRFRKKIDDMHEMGIHESKNLIITYDDEKGNIDLPDIVAIIEGRLLTWRKNTQY